MDDHFKEHRAALLKVLKATQILKEDNIPCQIEEGLYLGSLGAANTRNTLEKLNITHILSITSSPPSHPNDFVYKTILVPDKLDANISQYFNECFTFIDEARTRGRGVLVHCFAGKSRSVTVVVAYLMFKYGMSLSEAMGHVRSKRPVASPNWDLCYNWRNTRNLVKMQEARTKQGTYLGVPYNSWSIRCSAFSG